MKKLIIIFIICIIPYYSYASCQIKDNSADFLSNYFDNTKKVMSNIESAIGNIDTEDKVIIANKNEMLAIINKVFNFHSFFSSLRYFAIYPISNEIPSEIKRDYEKIENFWDDILNFIEKLDSNWNLNVKIEDICNWVENCDFDEELKVKEIAWIILKNNDSVLDLYRLTVMWEEDDFDKKILFVDNNFELEIKKYYWKEAISECNSEEGEYFDRIKKAIEEIKAWDKIWKEWIKEWKEAWALLIWKNTWNYEEHERELLQEYLSEQWIPMENKEIMLHNLSKYNKSWINKDNNFITNTISSTFWKISNQMKEWKDDVLWDFFIQNWLTNQKGEISIKKIKLAEDNSDISKDLKERIAELYNKELPYATIWDISTDELRARIINTHISLDKSINLLEKTIEISQDVCYWQDSKRWKCD